MGHKSFYSIGILFTSLFVLFIFSCKQPDKKLIESGVSIELATLRENQLSDIKYNLSFYIPDSVNEYIKGDIVITFNFKKIEKQPLILDFRNNKESVISVKLNHRKISYAFSNEHIIIDCSKLSEGFNMVEVEFISSNRALNRNPEYLYTLFVPDRACTAFPCFDQPSLKATFKPEISIPQKWVAVSNSTLEDTINDGNHTIYVFKETEPISTYLFSFVAGKFNEVKKTYPDREIVMYHRESDTLKVKQNLEKIFDLQYSSLKWLENYTQINYPFHKLDFIVIPSFQYSGMEHPGAILYRGSKLFLDQSAGIRDELNRANLIAHETAHMWFGDLVTMEWFSEVWLKEVFANFIAGKIVNPQYPSVNHGLNFLINHYPPAFSVDRTKGANPISQKLDNMKNAGTLYGSIIYHKAPIVMKHLEMIIGEQDLKDGLHTYLNNNKYGNATWDDLMDILSKKTDFDLKQWSENWVYKPGMPEYYFEKAFNIDDKVTSIVIQQTNLDATNILWNQNVSLYIDDDLSRDFYEIELADTINVLGLDRAKSQDISIIPNVNGLSYGYFQLDSLSIVHILRKLPEEKNPAFKCALYIMLYENMLNRNIEPYKLVHIFTGLLKSGEDAQNVEMLLNYISSIFWRFLNESQRLTFSANLEKTLWEQLLDANDKGIKSSLFKAYIDCAISDPALENLYLIWNKQLKIEGLNLSENDYTNVCFDLAIKGYNKSEQVLNEQYARIDDAERKNRFSFIKPALSADPVVRKQFFESMLLEENREKEPWVVTAMTYFNHPLRAKQSIQYIRPSLQILQELQITGDIFFPKQWLDAVFSGHNTSDAVIEINLFLNDNPDYPENLKSKILQSTDMVVRSSIIKTNN